MLLLVCFPAYVPLKLNTGNLVKSWPATAPKVFSTRSTSALNRASTSGVASTSLPPDALQKKRSYSRVVNSSMYTYLNVVIEVFMNKSSIIKEKRRREYAHNAEFKHKLPFYVRTTLQTIFRSKSQNLLAFVGICSNFLYKQSLDRVTSFCCSGVSSRCNREASVTCYLTADP